MSGRTRKEQIRADIEALNAIHNGELSVLDRRLEAVSADLDRLGETDLRQTVEEARQGLARGDLGSFRRLLSQAVSRMGHLR